MFVLVSGVVERERERDDEGDGNLILREDDDECEGERVLLTRNFRSRVTHLFLTQSPIP